MGYTGREIIGKHFSVFHSVEPVGAHLPDHELYVALQEGRCEDEGWRVKKDGSRYWANVIISPLLDDEGHLRGFSKVTRDSTERMEAAAKQRQHQTELENRVAERTMELQIAKASADDANQAKSNFLANMSHEIRTPLGAVLGFSELLTNPNLSASEKINYTAAIKRNGELLSNIINDILDLSKVEAGKLEVENDCTTMSEIVHDITSLVNLQALEKGLRFSVSAEGPIPNAIYTDALRLKQILMNIIGNAIKFTQKGSVEIKIRQIFFHGSLRLAFVVTDTGEGISPERAERLFTPFTQADSSTKRRFRGDWVGSCFGAKTGDASRGGRTVDEKPTWHWKHVYGDDRSWAVAVDSLSRLAAI